jgi:hypothetical protein
MKKFGDILQLLAAIAVYSSAHAGMGDPLWVRSYDGPQNSTEQAMATAVDANGNVFVTGQSIGSGNLLDYDYATIKYSGEGVPLWTNRYNGPAVPASSWDTAKAMAVDANGNVFVTGYSYGGASGYDYATVGYSNAGVPLWTNRYNGPGNGDDFAQAVAVDRNGNVFVTGNSTGSGSGYDYATIKYSGAGAPLWTNRYNGPGNGVDAAHGIATDTNGNVIITGYSTGSGSGYDYATIRYSGAGAALWTNRYNGPGNGDDQATALGLDAGGNVFVTGYSTNNSSGYDYATIGYSSAGVPSWTNRYDGPSSRGDRATALAVNASGNVLVTGSSFDGGYTTLAYSAAGLPLWTNRYSGPGGDDEAVALAADAAGNVFVTGYSLEVSSSQYAYAYATVAYSGTGAPLWTNRYPAQSYAAALAVDRSGNVFVTGYFIVVNANHDYATIKYAGVQPIPLDIQPAGDALVLRWANPTFHLQSAPAITGIFTNIPGATNPHTNIPTGPQQYFRLRLN